MCPKYAVDNNFVVHANLTFGTCRLSKDAVFFRCVAGAILMTLFVRSAVLVLAEIFAFVPWVFAQSPITSPAAAVWNALSAPAMDPAKSAHAENVDIIRDHVHINADGWHDSIYATRERRGFWRRLSRQRASPGRPAQSARGAATASFHQAGPAQRLVYRGHFQFHRRTGRRSRQTSEMANLGPCRRRSLRQAAKGARGPR